MARYKFIVMANARDGRNDDYREWYATQHMRDVMAVPGFVSCELLEDDRPDAKWRFSNLYDIESDDIDATMADVFSRAGTDRMPMSDSVDNDTLFASLYKPR
jgi:hypothetical protein